MDRHVAGDAQHDRLFPLSLAAEGSCSRAARISSSSAGAKRSGKRPLANTSSRATPASASPAARSADSFTAISSAVATMPTPLRAESVIIRSIRDA